LDEEQVNVLRKRAADGEFLSIDAAIAAKVDAHVLDAGLLEAGLLTGAYDAGLSSGRSKRYDMATLIEQQKTRDAGGA
jgi:hypothetical protein